MTRLADPNWRKRRIAELEAALKRLCNNEAIAYDYPREVAEARIVLSDSNWCNR